MASWPPVALMASMDGDGFDGFDGLDGFDGT